MRAHLEDVLLIARSHMEGFNLSDTNNPAANQYYFKMATHLSAYLHRQDPQAGGLLYAYLNPILLDIIRTAFYKTPQSLARQTYELFKKYPSLARNWNLTVALYNWRTLPVNAFVMGAVAVSTILFLF
jgi:hypothetical protein